MTAPDGQPRPSSSHYDDPAALAPGHQFPGKSQYTQIPEPVQTLENQPPFYHHMLQRPLSSREVGILAQSEQLLKGLFCNPTPLRKVAVKLAGLLVGKTLDWQPPTERRRIQGAFQQWQQLYTMNPTLSNQMAFQFQRHLDQLLNQSPEYAVKIAQWLQEKPVSHVNFR